MSSLWEAPACGPFKEAEYLPLSEIWVGGSAGRAWANTTKSRIAARGPSNPAKNAISSGWSHANIEIAQRKRRKMARVRFDKTVALHGCDNLQRR